MENKNITMYATQSSSPPEGKYTTPFLVHLAEIMDDSKFRSFFDSYFNEWDECKAVLMMMKTYQFLDRKFHITENKKLEKEEFIKILEEGFSNSEFRQYVIKSMNNFIDEENQPQVKFLK